MGTGFQKPRRYVNPKSLPEPRGFSNGVFMAVGPFGDGVLFIAGQIGCGSGGRIVSNTFTGQFDQALINVIAVVEAMKGTPESIGKLTIFVTDMEAYRDARQELGAIWRQRMGRHYPAMSLVEVKSLVDSDALVEIEGIAVIG
jgi:enamine deaminase RidA (YjgF/YER057c/UK114 family)